MFLYFFVLGHKILHFDTKHEVVGTVNGPHCPQMIEAIDINQLHVIDIY
jgi:hypothetical protein